jgi:UDP-glucose 4-epimerase
VTAPTHVLVTGGAGFIGSHLVGSLASRGYRVSVIDDLSRGSPEWIPSKTRLYEVDIRDDSSLVQAIADAKPDTVAHLAALHFIPAVDEAPQVAWDINVRGTQNLLSALRLSPVKRLLFASTAAVYPDSTERLSEMSPVGPIDLYGRTKLAGERMVEEFHAETGTECVVARLFNVIGHRETNPHVVVEIIEQLAGGAPGLELGSLHTRRDFTDVRDVAEALYRLLHQAPPGYSVFNVGSGRAVPVSEIVSACERVLGRRISVHTDPTRVRKVDREVLLADNSAIRALGWEPQWTLAETLTQLLESNMSNGKECFAELDAKYGHPSRASYLA